MILVISVIYVGLKNSLVKDKSNTPIPPPVRGVIVRLYDPQQSMPSVEITSKRQAAREVIDILSEISLILVCFSTPHPPSRELIS